MVVVVGRNACLHAPHGPRHSFLWTDLMVSLSTSDGTENLTRTLTLSAPHPCFDQPTTAQYRTPLT
eukprot:gene3530-6148_t